MNGFGRLGAVVAAQALVLAGWAGHHELLRQTAPTFRLALEPVDPYDLFRGRYFILNPADSGIERERPREGRDALFEDLVALLGKTTYFDGEVVVGFCPESRPTGEIERVCAVRRAQDPPPADGRGTMREVPAQANLWFQRGGERTLLEEGPALPRPDVVRGQIDLDLDRFFLPNRAVLPAPENEPGWEVEVIHRPGQPLLAKKLWFRGKPVEF